MSLATVKLADGRRLSLTRLILEQTYSVLLIGYPHRKLNETIIKRLNTDVAKEEERAHHTIVPTPIPYEHRGKTEERLPGIRCIGSFESKPFDNEGNDFSFATIGWFQEESGLPTPSVLASLDWKAVAKDGGL